MITNNYKFKVYRKQMDELLTLVPQVQSSKLAIILQDAAMSIMKLIDSIESKELLLTSRIQADFKLLKHWAPAVLESQMQHVHSTCHDGYPKFWKEDCPRCLAVVVANLKDSSNPYLELPEAVQIALMDALRPSKKRSSRQLSATGPN